MHRTSCRWAAITRFLWQQLPTTNAQGTSSIQDFKQTARGVTGSVQRAIDATNDKAEVTLTLDLVIEELVQWAVVISDIPNAMLEDIALLRQFLDAEMRYRIGLATDAHVVGQIISAAPSATATGDLYIETVRYAVADMRAAGASPSLLVLDPTDAVAARPRGATGHQWRLCVPGSRRRAAPHRSGV